MQYAPLMAVLECLADLVQIRLQMKSNLIRPAPSTTAHLDKHWFHVFLRWNLSVDVFFQVVLQVLEDEVQFLVLHNHLLEAAKEGSSRKTRAKLRLTARRSDARAL